MNKQTTLPDNLEPILAAALSIGNELELRIPVKLDTDSTPNWTRIPEQAGQSERSDAGFSGFTLLMS